MYNTLPIARDGMADIFNYYNNTVSFGANNNTNNPFANIGTTGSYAQTANMGINPNQNVASNNITPNNTTPNQSVQTPFNSSNPNPLGNPMAAPYTNPLTGQTQGAGLQGGKLKAFNNLIPDMGLPDNVKQNKNKKNDATDPLFRIQSKGIVDVNPQAYLNTGFAAIKTGINWFGNKGAAKCGPGTIYNDDTKQCMPMDSTQLAPIQNNLDRLDWAMQGEWRPQDMGSDRNSRGTFGNYAGSSGMAKYGLTMQNGGTNSYNIGDEVFMSPKELEEFLKAGGEVDYI